MMTNLAVTVAVAVAVLQSNMLLFKRLFLLTCSTKAPRYIHIDKAAYLLPNKSRC
jgi:hypothetical protein